MHSECCSSRRLRPLVQHAAITEHARVNKPAPEWRRALVLSPPKPEPPPALFDPLAM